MNSSRPRKESRELNNITTLADIYGIARWRSWRSKCFLARLLGFTWTAICFSRCSSDDSLPRTNLIKSLAVHASWPDSRPALLASNLRQTPSMPVPIGRSRQACKAIYFFLDSFGQRAPLFGGHQYRRSRRSPEVAPQSSTAQLANIYNAVHCTASTPIVSPIETFKCLWQPFAIILARCAIKLTLLLASPLRPTSRVPQSRTLAKPALKKRS